MDTQLLTVPETADHLSLSETKVWDLLRCGVLRGVKIGSSRRIPALELQEFVSQLRQAAVPPED